MCNVLHFDYSGDLTVAESLDYEKQKEYIMFVGVTDGELTDQAKVIIMVLNVNDNNPEFSHSEYTFDVPVQARINGALIGKIDVTDKDGDNVTLSLMNHAEYAT